MILGPNTTCHSECWDSQMVEYASVWRFNRDAGTPGLGLFYAGNGCVPSAAPAAAVCPFP